MQTLEHLVSLVNFEIANKITLDGTGKPTLFKGLFDNPDFLGLAQLANKKKGDKVQQFPTVCKTGGEVKYAGVDDMYTFRAYHRALGITSVAAKTGGYGRELPDLKNTYKMCLVIFCKKIDGLTHASTLAHAVQVCFPSVLKGEQKPVDLKSAVFQLNEIVLNEMQVFNEEFKNVESFVAPEHILMKVNYTIEITFGKKCVPCTSGT